jgi:plasmid stability protein
MASITLKNIPESLHSTYKRRAKAHSRSLQAEILRTLASSASLEPATESLSVDDVAGMLKPRRRGVTIPEMNKGIDQSLRDSWK